MRDVAKTMSLLVHKVGDVASEYPLSKVSQERHQTSETTGGYNGGARGAQHPGTARGGTGSDGSYERSDNRSAARSANMYNMRGVHWCSHCSGGLRQVLELPPPAGIMGADKLTANQIAIIKEAFSHFDKDGDGMITIEEFGVAMKSMGLNPTASDLKKKFTEFDVDGNGKIDFAEFLAEVEAAFRFRDKNGDGFIDAAELKQAMTNIGMKVTDKVIDKMIRGPDTDGDGQVSFEEFVAVITPEG